MSLSSAVGDGQSNPENFDEHRKVMVALSIQMPVLTAAWLLTGNRRYAEKACDHLRAWFVAPETRMNPNLLYALRHHRHAASGRSGEGRQLSDEWDSRVWISEIRAA